jgi:hypothetical protein
MDTQKKWNSLHQYGGKILRRMKMGDVLERYENYAAFKSDGQKVSMKVMGELVRTGIVVNAKPNVGAPYTIAPEAFQSAELQKAKALDELRRILRIAPREDVLTVLMEFLSMDDIDRLQAMLP